MFDSVAIGALFFLSAFVSALLGDPTLLRDGQLQPLSIASGIVGSVGVGALLSLAGSAIWNVFFPYNPRGGIRSVLPFWRSNFRAMVGPALRRYYDATDQLGIGDGDRALVATSYVFHVGAPSPVVEWVRRRHRNFSSALASATAIALGLLTAQWVTPVWTQSRWLATLALAIVAFLTVQFARGQRREADRMEAYWFRLPAELRDARGPEAVAPLEPDRQP